MGAPRRKNFILQETVEYTCDHVSTAATLNVSTFKTHPNRQMRIDRIDYVNPTGLVQDAANFFVIALKKGSTVIGSWSTQTGQQGTIAADTFVALVLSATQADLVVPAGTMLQLALTKNGTQTLPIGKIVVHGRYL